MSIKTDLYEYFAQFTEGFLQKISAKDLTNQYHKDTGVELLKTTVARYKLYYLTGGRKNTVKGKCGRLYQIRQLCDLQFTSDTTTVVLNPYNILKTITNADFLRYRGPDKYKISVCNESKKRRAIECSGKFVVLFAGQLFCQYCIKKNYPKLVRLVQMSNK